MENLLPKVVHSEKGGKPVGTSWSIPKAERYIAFQEQTVQTINSTKFDTIRSLVVYPIDETPEYRNTPKSLT